jgi:energy-coupling factor transporter ATP-binding protein EcfA2
VVGIFSKRFFVPFQLFVDNQTDVILNSKLPAIGFVFEERNSPAVSVKRDSLIKVLSTGEKRALYILNIIFEVEARKKAKEKTLFIIDDIADSFDYKNKYAIIEYLKDISNEDFFFQILLTHNFDFFRTLSSRFVGFRNCQMIRKSDDKVSLISCPDFNIASYFKGNLNKEKKVFVASIPLARNLVEYAKGSTDANFRSMTSMLHLKATTKDITVGDLIKIYQDELHLTGADFSSFDPNQAIVEFIHSVAEEIIAENEEDSINLQNKISLAIAIRLKAEEVMIKIIDSQSEVEAIKRNQTAELFEMVKNKYPDHEDLHTLIERVILMTPENIHLNSFMYEPIVDMADEHLKDLYLDLIKFEKLPVV